MADKPEILVHVGAPSTGSDDARYRALVASSLAFEPVSRYNVLRILDNEHGTGIEVSVDESQSISLASSSSSSLLLRREGTTSFNSGDELCSLVPPDDYEKSKIISRPLQPNAIATAQLNIKAPSFHPESTEEESELSFQPLIPLTHQSRIQSQQGSPQKLASVHDTSAGIIGNEAEDRNLPIVDLQHSTWETPLDSIPDSQEADQTILSDPVQVDRSFVPDSVLQTRRFERDKENWAEESRLSDVTRIPSSIPSPSPTDRHDDLNNQSHNRHSEQKKSDPKTAQSSASTSVLGKRKEVDTRNSASTTKTPTSEEPSSSSNHRPNKKRQTLPQATETISLANLPIEIRAPDPAVAYGKFRTHITPTLRSLAERMKQSSRFRPTRQTRELQPLERGYWFIPGISIVPDTFTTTTTSTDGDGGAMASQTWTQTLFSQFWCFLRDFLTEGRAGWGIWCLLEACDSNNNSNAENVEAKTVNLKLYTWGEVAPHMYLLLFLATERRIKKMQNVEWRDARDEGVIIMS